jgi:hypothetical protein
MLVNTYNDMQKNNYIGPLDKYFGTKTMQRTKGKGVFCGMDYINLPIIRPKEKYTRFDHSKNVAHSAWTLSEDLATSLAGAFHDTGTLSFAHANSFKKGDALTQANDELNVESVISQDEELLTYLHEDKINIADVSDYAKYPLLDKDVPAMCLDRVDGILATCLFWAKTHNFEQIKELYYMLCYFENLNGMVIDLSSERLAKFNGEIVINEHHVDADYEDWFAAINVYSKILLSKESRYLMEVFGLVLNYYEDIGLINEHDLFYLSEDEIINRILDSKYKDVWKDFVNIDQIDYVTSDSGLIIYSKPKIRQANPLCMGQMTVCEIHDISGDFYRELNDLKEDLSLVEKPLVSNLSAPTVKILSKYQKPRFR